MVHDNPEASISLQGVVSSNAVPVTLTDLLCFSDFVLHICLPVSFSPYVCACVCACVCVCVGGGNHNYYSTNFMLNQYICIPSTIILPIITKSDHKIFIHQ